MPRPGSVFATFHRWLVFFGVAVFGFFVAYQNGYLAMLLDADASHISALILSLLLVTSLDAGRRAYQLGREIEQTQRISASAETESSLFAKTDDGDVVFAVSTAGDSFAHQHLLLLANRTNRRGRLESQELLLERLENALGRGHETGWFVAELMIRLGLLGTVIGFIFMLGSVASVTSIDVQVLQQLLTSMSDGMRVALYTTLTGLGAGILLGFQYRLLDAGVDRLMAEIIELSEVHIVRHLQQLTGE
jgi:biopolymer transport protein ExbB/TolQ